MQRFHLLSTWLTLGMGIKRWLVLLVAGVVLVAVGITQSVLNILGLHLIANLSTFAEIFIDALTIALGFMLIILSVVKFSRNILAPYRRNQQGHVADAVYAHRTRQKGLKVVAIGGGTGLPSVLRGLKPFTSNITAVVTVADDGGSSGRLRRELGVLPPGDLRNNIAALADDESLMTQLFQYRFGAGDLSGHAFGNLFISALAGVTGSIESALIETERVLNIQGRVLPATLEDVHLSANVRIAGKTRPLNIVGESKITDAGGKIEQLSLTPPNVQAYSESVQAILDAGLVVIGPGSLFTSILPNLLVKGIAEALRASNAYIVYVCNVATQEGETDGFTVAEHVMALERHVGRGIVQAVLANNAYPKLNAGTNTTYVQPVPEHHEILQRYEIRYADLTDNDHPWRHDPQKLVAAILKMSQQERAGASQPKEFFTES
ncbi:MAG: uridine diphosphate-N-acetylglucosamine-binding protein YvcK [Anaerolineaceae bacterium]|nr:uridine diphosphate-N-acetylglucosamine-binding protein YvcK [Anaerolineaceae bacterium]